MNLLVKLRPTTGIVLSLMAILLAFSRSPEISALSLPTVTPIVSELVNTDVFTGQEVIRLLESVRNALIFFGVLVAMIVVVLAGWIYLFSGGNESKVALAKGYLLAAFVGLVIILSAIMLVWMVISAVGRREIIS